MKRKSILRFFVIAEAALFAVFGLILKNMDDSFGDKFIWTGIVTLVCIGLAKFIKYTSKNSPESEDVT